MPAFDDESAKRIAKFTRNSERDRRSPPSRGGSGPRPLERLVRLVEVTSTTLVDSTYYPGTAIGGDVYLLPINGEELSAKVYLSIHIGSFGDNDEFERRPVYATGCC